MKKFAFWAGTGFGTGYSPVAPGTVGALLGIPIAWLIHSCAGPFGQTIAALVCAGLAIPLCQSVEDKLGVKDPKQCVADEYLTFPLSVIGLPPLTAEGGWIIWGIAFLTHRFFDIVKFWPAHGLQRLKGGLGVLADDFFASLYALAANHMIYWLIQRQGLL